MAGPAFEPLIMSAWAWSRDDTRNALTTRDMGALFRAVQRYTGASQSRIAAATGMLQGRISEILKGNRSVSALEVFERIADGIAMPDEERILLGIAPRHPIGIDHLGPSGRAEVAAVYTSQQDAVSDIRSAAKSAREIDILAVRGLGIIGLNDSLLRAGIAGKDTRVVRALLVDPDSRAANRRAAEIGESVESFCSGVRLTVARLRDLGELPGVEVEVYLYNLLPTWRVIALDSTMFVSAFGEDHEGHLSPMYRLGSTAYGGALHRGFRRFVAELRTTSRRVV